MILQDSLNDFILQKKSNVYNSVRIVVSFENGAIAGLLGNDCNWKDTTTIPDYNFSLDTPFPNPCNVNSILRWENQSKSQVRVVLDDGTNSEIVFDKLSDPGIHNISLDLSNKVNGVYRITCYVKPEKQTEEKSISTYLFVAR